MGIRNNNCKIPSTVLRIWGALNKIYHIEWEINVFCFKNKQQQQQRKTKSNYNIAVLHYVIHIRKNQIWRFSYVFSHLLSLASRVIFSERPSLTIPSHIFSYCFHSYFLPLLMTWTFITYLFVQDVLCISSVRVGSLSCPLLSP